MWRKSVIKEKWGAEEGNLKLLDIQEVRNLRSSHTKQVIQKWRPRRKGRAGFWNGAESKPVKGENWFKGS